MLQSLIENYGYPIILLGTFLEGEAVLVLGGLAAKIGYLELHWVILSAFVGTVCGDQLYFFIGRYHGRAMLAKHPKWQQRANWINRHLERHQIIFILTFRFLYGIRSVTPFVIGMSQIKTHRFVMLHILGASIWAVSVGSMGYVFGKAVEVFLGNLKMFEFYAFGVIVVISLVTWLYYYRRRQRTDRSNSELRSGPDQ